MPAPVRVIASVSAASAPPSCSMVLAGVLGKTLRHLIEPRGHHLLQAGGHVGEFVVDMLGLEGEAVGQPRRSRR